jgi:hypothetical protein
VESGGEEPEAVHSEPARHLRLERWCDRAIVGICLLWGFGGVRAEWAMLHGNARHDGYVEGTIRGPFRLEWVREFAGERLGTAMEPIVGQGRVYVATHAGNVYALEVGGGAVIWRFRAGEPILHSPALADDILVVGSTDGQLRGLEVSTGQMRWSVAGGVGGYAASPVVDAGRAYIGDRAGGFMAVDVADGRVCWRRDLGAPVRQTAAVFSGRVVVTGEDLRVWCLAARDGSVEWTAGPLSGQSARDYYPMVVDATGGSRVIIRTSPSVNMSQRIARDRQLLARGAGADDTDWRKLEAWLRSDAARGSAEAWAREQANVRSYLERDTSARTFFILDAGTGEELGVAPVLWVGGCQGVGVMPVRVSGGRVVVMNRTAYGNWNLGVAPMVGLGLLEVEGHRITPLFHVGGVQPPWNTFWGTADESQALVGVGSTVLIVHQGTLSGFGLEDRRLFPIWGNRDTYGGFRPPGWAQNEWHGPGRGGVAVDGRRILWLTGSRVLCVLSAESGPAAEVVTVEAGAVPGAEAGLRSAVTRHELRSRLVSAVQELLSRDWAPLVVEPGLAGREFFYEHSGDLFEVLAWAYPHLPAADRDRVRERLAREWHRHPPYASATWYGVEEGAVREWAQVPEGVRERSGSGGRFHPFGNLHVVQLYAVRCGELERVRAAWPELRAAFEDFRGSGWGLEGSRGDLWANRYLASLIAVVELAEMFEDHETAGRAREWMGEVVGELRLWWERASAGLGSPRALEGVGELDRFIGQGGAFSFRVMPHRHKLALFRDMTEELAELLVGGDEEMGLVVEVVMGWFERLESTWWLVGEERQVHFGENLFDPPDHAWGAYRAQVWLGRMAGFGERARRVDLPFCRADLYHLGKLALAMEAGDP